jgi:hypothetical protein
MINSSSCLASSLDRSKFQHIRVEVIINSNALKQILKKFCDLDLSRQNVFKIILIAFDLSNAIYDKIFCWDGNRFPNNYPISLDDRIRKHLRRCLWTIRKINVFILHRPKPIPISQRLHRHWSVIHINLLQKW